MSIQALKKVTLFGLANEKMQVLDAVQKLGCLHLISLKGASVESEGPSFTQPQEVYHALRYLDAVPVKRRQVLLNKGFDLHKVVSEIQANQRQMRMLKDRIAELSAHIEALKPWGNFILPASEQLAGYLLWFYILPVQAMKELQRLELPWQVVHRNNRFLYVVVIAREEPHQAALPTERAHTGSQSLQQLIEDWEDSQIKLEEVRAERQALTRWMHLIKGQLSAAEDHDSCQQAARNTRDDDELFALQGWVPVRDLENLQQFATQQSLALLIEEPDAKEHPPTLLNNPPDLSAGEDLVGFYQTPGYRAWDPSLVVFLSFALFFAMILSDAGYAALLGVVLLFGWRPMGRSNRGRRLRVLAAALVTSSLVWGIVVGSYFGLSPAEETLAGNLKLLDINNFDIMMKLSVCIGVFHIALANAIMAWNARGYNRAWMHTGWIAAVCGGLLVWLSGEYAGLNLVGQVCFATGLLLVFLFGSERKVSSPVDLAWRVLEGLSSLTNITKLFGDVLSYLRLFALGLASASLALTFNNLAQQVAEAHPGTGILFALLILLVGHVLNILLSLMSGVVHGLRLNFIEFYNWGLSGEGYPFRAFSKKGEDS